jgi:hypothetical protein
MAICSKPTSGQVYRFRIFSTSQIIRPRCAIAEPSARAVERELG